MKLTDIPAFLVMFISAGMIVALIIAGIELASK